MFNACAAAFPLYFPAADDRRSRNRCGRNGDAQNSRAFIPRFSTFPPSLWPGAPLRFAKYALLPCRLYSFNRYAFTFPPPGPATTIDAPPCSSPRAFRFTRSSIASSVRSAGISGIRGDAPPTLLFRDRSFQAPRCPRFRCSARNGDYV